MRNSCAYNIRMWQNKKGKKTMWKNPEETHKKINSRLDANMKKITF